MPRIIKLTESELRGVIKGMINEYRQELSKIADDIIINTYNLNDNSDRKYIENNLNEIYNLLVNSYEKEGGIKGLSKASDIVKNSDIIRIAFHFNKMVAVSIYSQRLGGNKLMFCGSIQGENAIEGKIGLKSIIKRDAEATNEWNLVEASGAIEHYFRKYRAFNLPSAYASYVLGKKITIVDDFYYIRAIGKERTMLKKTIFGVNTKSLLQTIFHNCFGYVEENIDVCMDKLKVNQYGNTINEDGQIYKPETIFAFGVIDIFDEAYNEFEMYEMPSHLLKWIPISIEYLKNEPNKTRAVEQTLELANDLKDKIQPLTIIQAEFPKDLKNNGTRSSI